MSKSRININNAFLPSDLWSHSDKVQTTRPSNVSSNGARPALDINKSFLANTILNVESHNRFEEIQACWRQKDLNEQNRKRNRPLSSNRDSSAKSEQDIQRQQWAMRKAETQAVRELLPDVTYSSSSSRGFGQSIEAPPSHGPMSERSSLSAAAFAIYSSNDDDDDESDVESKNHKKQKKAKKEHKKDKHHSKKDKDHHHDHHHHKKNKSSKHIQFNVKLKEETVDKLKDS